MSDRLHDAIRQLSTAELVELAAYAQALLIERSTSGLGMRFDWAGALHDAPEADGLTAQAKAIELLTQACGPGKSV